MTWLSMCGFIVAQLAENCTGITGLIGSNPMDL